jgi:hypothetical protein
MTAMSGGWCNAMRADDASSAEMRRPPDPDADPLALDDDTLERLLSGTLAPAQVPPGFAKVAELLAAAAAAPSSAELTGQGAVLAELRAVTRGRPPATTTTPRTARTPRRRRRAGLAVVVVVGALVTGGVAGAATGHLPGPVRAAARTVLGTTDGGPSISTQAGQPPGPAKRPTGAGGGLGGARPSVSTGPGPGTAGAGPAATPNPAGLCQALVSGNGAEQGEKLDATAFEVLAKAAGGHARVGAYCQALMEKDQASGKPKGPKDTKQPKEPEQPGPSGTGGQGQGSPPPSTDGSQGQGDPPPERTHTP